MGLGWTRQRDGLGRLTGSIFSICEIDIVNWLYHLFARPVPPWPSRISYIRKSPIHCSAQNTQTQADRPRHRAAVDAPDWLGVNVINTPPVLFGRAPVYTPVTVGITYVTVPSAVGSASGSALVWVWILMAVVSWDDTDCNAPPVTISRSIQDV